MSRKELIKQDLITVDQFGNYLEKKWKNSKPLVKLFETDVGKYLYDPGTNKLLGCNNNVYMLVKLLLENETRKAINDFITDTNEEQYRNAAQDIIDAIETHKVLLATPGKFKFFSKHFTDLENLCGNSLGQLIIETTANCNLACQYCVFNSLVSESRVHNNKPKAQSTAFAAIDYLEANSSKQEKVYVTFYGGEPLLDINLLKACVDYAKKRLKGKKVQFSVTTNAVLITRETADFFSREGFNITASIDGPEEIHDFYRLDKRGIGTFKRSMKGLKLLIDTYGEPLKNKIRLSMVYAPPYSEQKINRIAELWEEYPWLYGITPTITYPHPGSIPQDKIKIPDDLKEDKTLIDWASERYLDDYVNKRDSHPLVKEMIIRGLIKIFKRPIFSDPVYDLYLNGCCMPAARKIFVSVEGEFALCERIHKAAPIPGTVSSGINMEKLKKVYVEEYSEKSLPYCSKCWANRLCGACYIDAYSDKRFDANKKMSRCESILYSVEKYLKLYTKLLKIDPEGLNYLDEIEIT